MGWWWRCFARERRLSTSFCIFNLGQCLHLVFGHSYEMAHTLLMVWGWFKKQLTSSCRETQTLPSPATSTSFSAVPKPAKRYNLSSVFQVCHRTFPCGGILTGCLSHLNGLHSTWRSSGSTLISSHKILTLSQGLSQANIQRKLPSSRLYSCSCPDGH